MKLKLLTGIIAFLYFGSVYAQDSIKVYPIDEVVVTASRMNLPVKNLPQKVEIVNRSAIEAIPNENLGEVLKRTVNLNIIQYPGAMTTVGLRGFPPTAHSRNYTLILMDGVPAGTNNLATIPSDCIERIEVVKGPYAVLYGSDAMGGVINIITRKSSKEVTGNIGVSVGNFGQTSYTGYISGAIAPKLLFSMGFSRQQQSSDYRIGSHNLLKCSDMEKNILDKKSYGDVMTNSEYQINQFNGKLEYRVNDKWSIGLHSVLTASNDIETPGNYWHSYGMQKKDISRIANYAEVKYAIENNELIFSPYLSDQKESNYNNNTDSAFINSREKIRQYGMKIGNTHTWGDLKWLAGLDYDAYDVGMEKFSAKSTPETPYRPDNNRKSISGFTQLAYSRNNWSVNAGVRYNYIAYTLEASSLLHSAKKSAHYSNLNPSLGVKYTIIPGLAIHGSLGSAFYVPDAYKMAGTYTVGKKVYIGNKDLKPETNLSYDLGISYGIGDCLNLDLSYFQNYYKNKIVDDKKDDGTISYKNASHGVMNGTEILLSSNVARLWNAPYRLELYGGLTYFLNNRFKDQVKNASGEMNTLNRNTLYTRDMTANFGVNFMNNQGFEAHLIGRYAGHRLENDWMYLDNLRPDIKLTDYYAKGGYTANDRVLRHPEYLTFDLSSYYTINRKIRIGISISNLLDENYTEKDGYNMPGRSIMGHVSYRF